MVIGVLLATLSVLDQTGHNVVRMDVTGLAARDGPACWLCGGEVDLEAPRSSPAAPSIDHVVPRSRGGRTEPANLRLAHRSCNGRRANGLPELAWPAELGVVDAAPLWSSLARLVRRPGAEELVALLPDAERAALAADWARERAGAFVGGTWLARTAPARASGSELHGLWLALDEAGGARDPGRPLVGDPRRGRERRSRRRRARR